MKRYPEYKDSGIEWIGKFPRHWKLIFLKYILKPGQNGIKIGPFGSSIKSNMLVNDGYKIYGQENIIKDNFEIGDRYITEQKFIELGVYELKENDVVITMMGTTGKSQVVPRYISILINDSNYIKVQLKISSKGSIMEGLNSTIVKSLLIALPSTKEQEVITYFLNYKTTQIDDLIDKKQRLIELLKEQRAAMINRAVTKGLNPNAPMKDSGIEWLGKIPEHWEIKKLKYVTLSVQTGSTPPSGREEYYIPGEVDWFTPIDFDDKIILNNSNRKISKLAVNESATRLFPAKSVLLVGIGATLGKVGIIEYPASSNQQINAIIFSKNFNPYFGAFYLRSIQDVLVSLSNAATLSIFNQSKTKEILIPMPSLCEQEKIVAFIFEQLKKIDKVISKISNEIELLKEYRTALISEVVTGKIDVRDFVPDKTNSR
jgi:type I restriction enzyme S subunit